MSTTESMKREMIILWHIKSPMENVCMTRIRTMEAYYLSTNHQKTKTKV
jgi:hypothetical protein